MERTLYGYVLPCAVAFLLIAVGIYFVLESVPTLLDIVRGTPIAQQPEITASQQVFKDVLQTVLAVAALAIAAFGYGAYKILSSQIEDNVRKQTETRYQKSLAYQRVSIGYIYWLLYENSKEQPKTAEIYLNKAIEHTQRAYEEHVINLNTRAPEVEHLICQIRNNLAYYVSEKHISFGQVDSAAQSESLSFMAWLERRIENYPSNSSIYLDTIEVVRKRFSASKMSGK